MEPESQLARIFLNKTSSLCGAIDDWNKLHSKDQRFQAIKSGSGGFARGGGSINHSHRARLIRCAV
jgi:hypothetical protein